VALPKQSEDFPAWYQAVVKGAELAEPSLVRGTMVIRPYGFAIWERIQQAVDRRIKETGHENLYFPLLIPSKLLEKEAEHVEGFAPEVAVVTHAGGEKLEEPIVIRPTSETIIWATYAKWIQSYRDLPLLYNQWANVVRWELRPRLFLRTTEFLWQEGHTAHETAEEAMAEARTILDKVYRDAVEDVLALPVRLGRKSASERFAGAEETFAIEALMRDGRALQSGTSHYLGQNFAKAYEVKFLGRDGKEEYAWASSWGVSTRLVGALIMAHGDDAGLRLPPALAPIQVVIVPIHRTDEEKVAVDGALWPLVDALQAAGVRVFTDDREEHRPGYKFNEWELKGVPVRLELGPKDVAKGEVVLYRRDLREKSAVPLEGIAEHVLGVLDSVQGELFAQALAFLEGRTFRPSTYEELKALIKDPGGFVEGLWCGRPACEERVKADTKATIRTLTLDPVSVEGTCIVCGEPTTELAAWAQAY
jgi:prolyl-tRNA synthetase